MFKKFLKVVVAILGLGSFTLFALAWLYGVNDSWQIGQPLAWIGLSCIVACIALYPLAIREEGQRYWDIFTKYFF